MYPEKAKAYITPTDQNNAVRKIRNWQDGYAMPKTLNEMLALNKASYSDDISKLATVNQARERYKLSRNLLLKIAEDNGAVRRIGRASI